MGNFIASELRDHPAVMRACSLAGAENVYAEHFDCGLMIGVGVRLPYSGQRRALRVADASGAEGVVSEGVGRLMVMENTFRYAPGESGV